VSAFRFASAGDGPFPDPPDEWLDELSAFLRIPSVSGDETHAADRRLAAGWVAALLAAGGASAEVREHDGLSPYVVGRLTASPGAAPSAGAPHVLIYGHADVQPEGDARLWTSPPYAPQVRDGWLYARGSADDKGNLYALVKGALTLAAAGELPVDVTFLIDTDEETSGVTAPRFLRDGSERYDACLIYDALTQADGELVFVAGARGLLVVEVTVRTGEAEVHSGFFGGAALNAGHVLTRALGRVIDVPEPLRAGVVPVPDAVLAQWEGTVDPEQELRRAGARAISPEVLHGFFAATYAEPSLDVNGIASGDAIDEAMIVPCAARAHVSMRLTPDQDPELIAASLTDLLTSGRPAGAELDVRVLTMATGAALDLAAPAVRVAIDAVRRVTGRPPVMVPNGATIPLLSALARRGIPAVLTGFALPASNLHGPDEGLPLNALTAGAALSAEILRGLGAMAG
jgi:acetylornithine deacetylase/succinyl-diaminopimelate desuccinylase-like protein